MTADASAISAKAIFFLRGNLGVAANCAISALQLSLRREQRQNRRRNLASDASMPTGAEIETIEAEFIAAQLRAVGKIDDLKALLVAGLERHEALQPVTGSVAVDGTG